MSEPFISEIRMFGFNFAPRGWAFCNGQILPITQNQPLYALVGTAYGGDGVSTFGLPELRGRVPVHIDTRTPYAYERGIRGGLENVALNNDTLGAHTHSMKATSDNATTSIPGGGSDRMLAASVDKDNAPVPVFGPPTNLTTMAAGTIKSIGGGEVHNNMQPCQVVNFCIALQGTFPSRN